MLLSNFSVISLPTVFEVSPGGLEGENRCLGCGRGPVQPLVRLFEDYTCNLGKVAQAARHRPHVFSYRFCWSLHKGYIKMSSVILEINSLP